MAQIWPFKPTMITDSQDSSTHSKSPEGRDHLFSTLCPQHLPPWMGHNLSSMFVNSHLWVIHISFIYPINKDISYLPNWMWQSHRKVLRPMQVQRSLRAQSFPYNLLDISHCLQAPCRIYTCGGCDGLGCWCVHTCVCLWDCVCWGNEDSYKVIITGRWALTQW